MNSIPETWADCELGELADIVGGGTPDAGDATNFTNDGGIPWLTPADLSGNTAMYVRRGRRNLTQKGFASSSAKLMPKGTVLFSSRAPIGYVAIAANEICTNQGFKSFICGPAAIPEYLYFYLKYIRPIAEQMASGTTFLELSGSRARKLPFILPPVPEQRRIVAKLEELLGKVEACQKRLDRVPLLLKRFRQAVLAAACEGRLTKEFRTSSGFGPHEWRRATLSEVADLRLGKMLDKKTNVGKKTRYLRNINVRWFAFDLSDIASLNATSEDKKKLAIKNGDLLICEGGEPGRCAVWDHGSTDLIFQKAIHRVRPNADLLPSWLAFNLRNDAWTGRLEEYFTGTTIRHLTGQSLARYQISLPPTIVQDDIIRGVKALFLLADRIEARYESAKKSIDRLTQSILAKAFRGELVPQDPNDEPASVLLERMMAGRKAADSCEKSQVKLRAKTHQMPFRRPVS